MHFRKDGVVHPAERCAVAVCGLDALRRSGFEGSVLVYQAINQASFGFQRGEMVAKRGINPSALKENCGGKTFNCATYGIN